MTLHQMINANTICLMALYLYSSHLTFIYMALFTVQIVSKQLYSDNRKMMQQKKRLFQSSFTVITGKWCNKRK